MTPQQISIRAGLDIFFKFMEGKAEHKGTLSEKPCRKFMKPEILDLINYYYTMDWQDNRAIGKGHTANQLLRTGCMLKDWHLIEQAIEINKQAWNIIEFGNETGTVYND